MATQRKKSKPRRKTTRKKQATVDYTVNIIGFIFIMVSLFAGLKLGFIGALCANVLRLFVGDTYAIGAILLALLGFYLLIYGGNAISNPNFLKAHFR